MEGNSTQINLSSKPTFGKINIFDFQTKRSATDPSDAIDDADFNPYRLHGIVIINPKRKDYWKSPYLNFC